MAGRSHGLLTLLLALLAAVLLTCNVAFAQAPNARASHILVNTEAECDALLVQLNDADNLESTFAELASANSKCPSKRKGGDLGYFGRGQMVSEFDRVVFEKPVGLVHKVHTQVNERLGSVWLAVCSRTLCDDCSLAGTWCSRRSARAWAMMMRRRTRRSLCLKTTRPRSGTSRASWQHRTHSRLCTSIVCINRNERAKETQSTCPSWSPWSSRPPWGHHRSAPCTRAHASQTTKPWSIVSLHATQTTKEQEETRT